MASIWSGPKLKFLLFHKKYHPPILLSPTYYPTQLGGSFNAYTDKNATMNSLADGFLNALEADFEHLSASAFVDENSSVELGKTELADIKDWSSLNELSSPFPAFPSSEYTLPRPSSRSRVRTAERKERQRTEQLAPITDQSFAHGDLGSLGTNTSQTISVASVDMTQVGWSYSKGWRDRPRVSKMSNRKISQNIRKQKKLMDERWTRPPVLGKKNAHSFGKLPGLEKAKPKSYAKEPTGTNDLTRLRYIWVDLSQARNPGPRYVINPVSNRKLPEVKNTVRGDEVLVQGSSMVTGFAKSLAGNYPSIDSYNPSYGDISMMEASYPQNPNFINEEENPSLTWAGRPVSGSIYANDTGGVGPAKYNTLDSWLQTSAGIAAERTTFSPANSMPSSPSTNPINSRPTSRGIET